MKGMVNGLYVDPARLVQMIKMGQNPQQLMLSVLETQMGNTPLGANLLTLAKNGKTVEIERIVRNLAQQQGINYDTEFNAFKQRLGLK